MSEKAPSGASYEVFKRMEHVVTPPIDPLAPSSAIPECMENTGGKLSCCKELFSEMLDPLHAYNENQAIITSLALSCCKRPANFRNINELPIEKITDEDLLGDESRGICRGFKKSIILPGISLLITSSLSLAKQLPLLAIQIIMQTILFPLSLCSRKTERVFDSFTVFAERHHFRLVDVAKNIYHLSKATLLSVPLLGHALAAAYEKTALFLKTVLESVVSFLRNKCCRIRSPGPTTSVMNNSPEDIASSQSPPLEASVQSLEKHS